MKRIYFLCLMLCLTACGSETDSSVGMQNQPPSVVIKEHHPYRYKVNLRNASEDVIISINNLPSWAEFDPDTNLITGIPGHDSADQDYTFSISAVDGEESFRSEDATISVKHSNLQLVETPQAKLLLTELSPFSQGVTVDSDLKTLSYSLINAPEWMVINTSTGLISGTPSHAYVDQTYSVRLAVSDGKHEVQSDPFELTVTPMLNLNPEIKVLGVNASEEFSVNQNIILTFDQVVELSAISVSAPNGACVSNIQISDNDFETCINLEPIYPIAEYDFPPYDDSKTEEENELARAEVQLRADNQAKLSNQLQLSAAKLVINKNYQLKITTFINTGFDYSLETDFTSSFQTVSGLIITEVGSRVSSSDMHWFEIYNASKSVINLQDYIVRTRAIPIDVCDRQYPYSCLVKDEHDFTLNNYEVQPGQYIVVRGNDWDTPYEDHDRVTYIGAGFSPYWDDFGYIELIFKDPEIPEAAMMTEDYIRFGNWTGKGWFDTPIDSKSWTGINYQYAPLEYTSNQVYGGSIGRRGELSDSNSNLDWYSYEIHTAGGPNDVMDADIDDDQDGIPDYAEQEGETYAGMSLYKLGARAGVRDIFIELDYMDSLDEGVIPREEALQKVVDVFSAQGIAVHFDVGDLFDQTGGVINPARFDLGGGNKVAFHQGVTLVPSINDTRAGLYEIKRKEMNFARFPIFHYMLMAFSQQADGSSGSGGFAEVHGNDSAITLGAWGLNSADEAKLNALINLQAITIMHELGHNLGLKHGGDEHENFKPNYVSIMNYLYAIRGLPTIGDNEGDRYYYEKNLREGYVKCELDELTNPVNGSYQDFIMDYSSTSAVINERSILEASGLKMQGSAPIDYDCNGNSTETLINFDVNYSASYTELSQPSDWDSIYLKFQKLALGNFGASRYVPQPNDLKLIEDVIGDDSAEVIYERPLEQSVMDEIRSY